MCFDNNLIPVNAAVVRELLDPVVPYGCHQSDQRIGAWSIRLDFKKGLLRLEKIQYENPYSV